MFEQLNRYLKSNNPILTFVISFDDFSQFLFVFLVRTSAHKSVIQCVCRLFSIFITLHSSIQIWEAPLEQRALSVSLEQGHSTSLTNLYNLACNGQAEKYNETVWKSITIILHYFSTHNIRTTHLTTTTEFIDSKG